MIDADWLFGGPFKQILEKLVDAFTLTIGALEMQTVTEILLIEAGQWSSFARFVYLRAGEEFACVVVAECCGCSFSESSLSKNLSQLNWIGRHMAGAA